MDRFAWARSWNPADIWSLIEEERQRGLIQSRIADRQQFEHVMAELYIWGWLRGVGADAELAERDGEPDIGLYRGAEPSWAEVKVLAQESKPSRVCEDIKKANRQIKNAGGPDAAGVLFLRVARSSELRPLDDEMPSEVASVRSEVEQALASAYRSVERVVLYWDETTALSDPRRGTVFTTRRRSRVVAHPSPKRRLFTTKLLPDLGATVFFLVGPPGSPNLL
jgi:hypothetical protein